MEAQSRELDEKGLMEYGIYRVKTKLDTVALIYHLIT